MSIDKHFKYEQDGNHALGELTWKADICFQAANKLSMILNWQQDL